MPAVTGILETALYVSDLDRSAAFYKTVLGFEPMLGDERFMGLRIPNKQVLLLFKKGESSGHLEGPGGWIPPHDADGRIHLAFAIAEADIKAWEAALGQHAVPVESKTISPQGSTSLYFRDLDGHLLELATPHLWPNY